MKMRNWHCTEVQDRGGISRLHEARRRFPYLFTCAGWMSLAILLSLPGFAAGGDAGTANSESAPAAAANAASAPSTIDSPEKLKYALASGANGPIPAIVVDQFGYPAAARKIAVIRDPQIGYDSSADFTPGASIALVDVVTGKVVKTGAPVPWNAGQTDPASGDRAWWFDFSDISQQGRYVIVDIEHMIRSPAFNIGDDVYKAVLKRATKTFFYQRAGQVKLARFAGAAWADAASHMGPDQDPYSKPWPGTPAAFPPDTKSVRDLRGGWYDAGDYNKYTTWAARYITVLLRAYEENPQAFGDDFEIPESGNGIPDLLDEVKWALDWLMRMQRDDGSVLCVQNLAAGTPPSSATGPSNFGPPTTSASLMAAAAFAQASKVYQSQPLLKDFAADLAKRAQAAWTWAHAHPSVFYWNNDEARQPGSKGLAYGQQELNDVERALAKFEAAINLYELTGDPSLKEYAIANYASLVPQYGPTLWEIDRQDALLQFSKMKDLPPELARSLRLAFLGHLTRPTVQFEAELQKTDAYRAPIQQYTWGSNKAKAMQARLFQLVAVFTQDEKLRDTARSDALEYLHYIHGVNPLGLVYLTNMGKEGATHSANTMLHAWFWKGTPWEKVADGKPGPAPGYIVGGPNQSFTVDSCCFAAPEAGKHLCYGAEAEAVCKRGYSPPMGQPPAKSYLQFNESWPANSWEVAEPSGSYQVYYIRLLASYVR